MQHENFFAYGIIFGYLILKGSNVHGLRGYILLAIHKMKYDNITVQGIKFPQSLENISPRIIDA